MQENLHWCPAFIWTSQQLQDQPADPFGCQHLSSYASDSEIQAGEKNLSKECKRLHLARKTVKTIAHRVDDRKLFNS